MYALLHAAAAHARSIMESALVKVIANEGI